MAGIRIARHHEETDGEGAELAKMSEVMRFSPYFVT